MGRKKKNQNIEAAEEKKPKLNIASEAKRSAVAIFLFALALVIFLGFFGSAGVIGNKLGDAAGIIMGWAKFVFPLFLVIVGIVLLLRKEKSFYIIKIIGLFITFLAIVAFLHWFFDPHDMKKVAKAGEGGGYIGYGLAYLLTKYVGKAGSFVVTVAVFFIGIIVAFDFSIMKLVNIFRKHPEEEAAALTVEGEEKKEEERVVTLPLDSKPEEKETAPTKEENEDAKNNIGKIQFVEGPDQYLSPGLEEGEYVGGDPEKKRQLKRNLNHGRRAKDKWNLPPLDLLETSSGEAKGGDVEKNAEIIQKTLKNFGIDVEIGEIKTGPAVTQYSFRPAVGVKISKILALQNDLALALAAHPIRIEAPIPGKSLVGIEVPNKVSAMVRMREILESSEFKYRKSNLTVALGKDVSGNVMFADLAKMPHLLVAGATGTGKSVCINSIIATLLYQNSPQDLKFIMVDPKRVELSLYNDIPHLLSGVIVENGKVVNALKWAVGEMERRYRLLQDAGSRDINSYQEKVREGKKRKYSNPETGEVHEEDLESLPFIVIIIDELADLMGSHGKEVEGAIVRIAQMARAVGIHLIVSTQRPSVEVLTGLIKANITTRIALQVATQIDSRTIIDMGGAEKLLGRGDLLFLSSSSPKPKRIQGIYVSESEVKRVVKFIADQKRESGKEESIGDDIVGDTKPGLLEFNDATEGSDQEDQLFEAAKQEVIRARKASASLLQRRLRVGYARAARLIDILEQKGIVGPADGAKPREVFASASDDGKEVSYEDATQDQEVRDKWQM